MVSDTFNFKVNSRSIETCTFFAGFFFFVFLFFLVTKTTSLHMDLRVTCWISNLLMLFHKSFLRLYIGKLLS